MKITDVEHRVVDIDQTRAHAYNQVNVRRLRSGDLVAVYNEERFPYHHDSGQTVLLRSRDNGDTWTDRNVVLPYTDTTANWDCGICELDDGALLVNFTMAAYFKRGIRPEPPTAATTGSTTRPWRSTPRASSTSRSRRSCGSPTDAWSECCART